MIDREEWLRREAEHQAKVQSEIDAAMAKSTVFRDFYSAARFAKNQNEQDGLSPVTGEYGERRWCLQQGLQAAVHGREDTAAVLTIQLSLLRRLEGLRRLAWAGLALITYIAVRVS